MLKMINGVWHERYQPLDEWNMSIHKLGNGHAEVSISRPTAWRELPPDLAARHGEFWQEWVDEQSSEEALAERARLNALRSARRAKTKVRRLVKVLGLDTLLTLTYRGNQQDLPLCKRHFKEFVRRLKRVLPGFVYVAAFERQKRGAWHVHIACRRFAKLLDVGGHHVVATGDGHGVKVKSYNVIRAVWRGVTGEWQGTINDSRRKGLSVKTPAKLAAYLSKYMTKAFEEGEDWSNRYSATSGVPIPKPVLLTFRDASLNDLIALAYDEVAGGQCRVSSWLSRWKDLFFLSTERLATEVQSSDT